MPQPSAQQSLLDGIRVLEIGGEPVAMSGRMLADLGADVVKVEPVGGDPLRRAAPLHDGTSLRFRAWHAGKRVIEAAPGAPELTALLAGSDIVLDTPGFPAAIAVDPAAAPHALWVRVTPFGLKGPRSDWRASDLGIMAASGNMFSTGYPDRAPTRCSEPTGYAHGGAEAALAAVFGVLSGEPQIVDVSMQEAVIVASMGAGIRYAVDRDPGQRLGASMGRSREIWHCKDGFVAFGLRGGPARVPTLRMITKQMIEDGVATPAWTDREWSEWSPNETSDEEFRALEEPLARYFEGHTMSELFELACENNIMLAPANSPREIYASAQLRERGLFCDVGALRGVTKCFVHVRSADAAVAPTVARIEARPIGSAVAQACWPPRSAGARARSARTPGALAGIKLLELGSGAAGPIATRYFAEHGAQVVKIESFGRPDFLRIYAIGAPGNRFGMEGSPIFNALNYGKQSITLDLKHPGGIAIAKRLVQWADAVLENFAPKAMRGFGLDYDSLAGEKPDLVMLSSCMNGQTGPHRDYPGFGSQGSALSGYNYLTGWPDREPMGPAGTITDSLSPRFAATALGAALYYRERTGRGCYLDISQVEAGLYALSPWLLDYANNDRFAMRMGNRSERTAPHGAFPCRGDDRWIAISCWSDAEWCELAEELGLDATERERFATLDARLSAQDALEERISVWSRAHTREEIAERLQSRGVEAVPVQDFADTATDPQLAARGHTMRLEHSVCGALHYERNGIRFATSVPPEPAASPALGEHTTRVLSDALGIDAAELARLVAAGGIEVG